MAKYYSEAEAGVYCRVSADIIKRANVAGDLASCPGMVIEGRKVAKRIYEEAELDRWMADASTLTATSDA